MIKPCVYVIFIDAKFHCAWLPEPRELTLSDAQKEIEISGRLIISYPQTASYFSHSSDSLAH
jgi:hypothetical protein